MSDQDQVDVVDSYDYEPGGRRRKSRKGSISRKRSKRR